jgi:hypothetical protein
MAGGGWGEIRTHGELAPTPVFKTGALNHSATHPHWRTNPLTLPCHHRNAELDAPAGDAWSPSSEKAVTGKSPGESSLGFTETARQDSPPIRTDGVRSPNQDGLAVETGA